MITGKQAGKRGNPLKYLNEHWKDILLLIVASLMGSVIGWTITDYWSTKYGW